MCFICYGSQESSNNRFYSEVQHCLNMILINKKNQQQKYTNGLKHLQFAQIFLFVFLFSMFNQPLLKKKKHEKKKNKS